MITDDRYPYLDLRRAAGQFRRSRSPSRGSRGGIGENDWYDVGRRRERLDRAETRRSQHRLCGLLRRRHRPHDHKLGQSRASWRGPQNEIGLAAKDVRYRFQWNCADRDLAARSEHPLPRCADAVAKPERGAELGRNLSGSDPQRQDEAGQIGRPDHPRRHRHRGTTTRSSQSRNRGRNRGRSGSGPTTASCS